MPKPGYHYPRSKPKQPDSEASAFTDDGCMAEGVRFFCASCPFPKCRTEVPYPTFQKWVEDFVGKTK